MTLGRISASEERVARDAHHRGGRWSTRWEDKRAIHNECGVSETSGRAGSEMGETERGQTGVQRSMLPRVPAFVCPLCCLD